jgi:opacity protein-like surface antigen
MIRHILAIAVALGVSASSSWAQTAAPQRAELTVKMATADVHKFAGIGSPVIGKASRGTVLEIRRNLGSWVEVAWPEGENGVAFLHVNTGTISHGTTSALPTQYAAASATPALPAEVNADVRADQVPSPIAARGREPEYVSLPSHVVGIGASLSGSAPDFGATTRMWLGKRLGFQFEVSRSRVDSLAAQGHTSSLLFAPSALFSLPDGVAGSVWLRPYAGAGSTLHRSTFNSATSNLATQTQTDGGFQTFGGAEATFAGVPRFGLSADVGYRWSQPSFEGAEPQTLVFAIAAHWYVK